MQDLHDGARIAQMPGFDVTVGTTAYGGRVAIGDVTGEGHGDLVASEGRDDAGGDV